MKYALYEQIEKGYAMRLGVYVSYEIALDWMQTIAFCHGKLFIEPVK